MKKLKGFSAEVAVFCGSGLNDMIEFETSKKVSYKTLGFEYAKVEGHDRFLEFGTYKGKKIVLASRFHFYEDGSADDMYYLVHILKNLGVKTIIATTSAGALNIEYEVGDLVLIQDHINFSSTNPFVGKLPIKFVDMTNAYDKELRETAKSVAKKLKIKLREGVHVQTIGPSYETPAEVKFFRAIGGDTVSMSMAHGAISACHLGIKFVGLANVVNKAACENSQPITHAEVLRVSKNSAQNLGKIVLALIEKI